MHDLINSVAIIQAVAPQTVQAAPVTSAAIDMQGAESLALVVAVGAIGETLDANNRIDVKIEHADDDGSGSPAAYAACTDADVIGAQGLNSGVFLAIDAAAKAGKRHTLAYAGGKRFVRVSATPVSLESGGALAILAIKGNLAQTPQA